MGFIQNLFSGGTSQPVNSVGNALDKVIITKGEKMQLDNEMKKADHQFKIDMQNLSPEDKKAMLGDVDGARKMNAAVQQSSTATRLSKNVSPILALGGALLCFALFGWLMFGDWNPKEESKKEVVLYVLGVLSGILTQVFSYYFGSSLGSAAKSEHIQTMHKNMMADKN